MNSKKPVINRFQSRKSIRPEKRNPEQDVFGGNPIPNSDYHIMLEDMISMSIRRHGRPLPMLKLQGEILQDIVAAEDTVTQYKKLLAELEGRSAKPAEIDYVKSELSKYRRLKYALRDIGDGIAWRFLGFDRFVLSQMGSRARKQHINAEGTVKELQELGDVINKNNRVAILNDVTNILKKGDITAELKDNSIELIEVKSSNSKNKRVTRQKNNLQQTVSILNEGEKNSNGEIFRTTNLALEPKSYIKNVEKFLVRAERDHAITEKIGDHLMLHVVDFTSDGPNKDPEPSYKKLETEIGHWNERNDFILTMTSTDRHRHVQNFAPFSIFPINQRIRTKLMTGAAIVSAYVNVTAVLRYLSDRGWSVVKGPEEIGAEIEGESEVPRNIAIAILRKGALTVHLPVPIVGRLGHEFLSVKTLGDMLDALLEMGPSSADAVFFNLEGEAQQWD